MFPYGSIMFFNIRRKIMGPVIFRDEVKVGDRGRGEGGQNRFFPWVADGCRREPIHEISIIRGRLH
jgi:hypothetical protein